MTSIGKAQGSHVFAIGGVEDHVHHQREHHQQITFQDEFRTFLKNM